ncbi:lysophospholipase [Bifidobacterium sp. DSM 109958]|uniref:Lysophospholipase n=1 Tax=Bifidobacterium moraviense TaxID=2675323 RepID=A0A7Y0F318_9BIFI|nr:alpha/beta hydrolase [Bifidobacterium sp. DSM 109958]NMN01001.1 lysophospholipase [Bifidobacterium sp. DSM 109958]
MTGERANADVNDGADGDAVVAGETVAAGRTGKTGSGAAPASDAAADTTPRTEATGAAADVGEDAGTPSAAETSGTAADAGRDGDARARRHARMEAWRDDDILAGYQRATVHLGPDGEGPDAVATFVRKDPERLTLAERLRRLRFRAAGKPLAIMYLHGWNDYFYRRHASEYWESMGVAFYAVDLRRYGRSYRPGETAGYVEDLHEYFAELDALRDVIVREMGEHVRILGIGHSEGGLVMSLWAAHEHPHHVRSLALNSPWLELQGNTAFRIVTTPVLKGFLLAGGKTPLPLNDPGFYGRTIEKATGGEWDYPSSAAASGAHFQPRAGWMQAIFNGQAEVAAGLDIQVPVLVCTSDSSMIMQGSWDERMRESDVVLDVTAIRQAALRLGDLVSIARIRGGIHDLTMSRPAARRRYFGIVTAWANETAWRTFFPARLVERALGRL